MVMLAQQILSKYSAAPDSATLRIDLAPIRCLSSTEVPWRSLALLPLGALATKLLLRLLDQLQQASRRGSRMISLISGVGLEVVIARIF
jgi:hypothetical protein